ncbi:Pentatricopeptide repeat-containing protein [Drosera capensis]
MLHLSPSPSPSPPLAARLPPRHLSSPTLLQRYHHHHHHSPLSAQNDAVSLSSPENDAVSPLSHPRVDFKPLIDYLSTTPPPSSDSLPPSLLDPTELRLAESYRAVPSHYWHAVLKTLASSPSSFDTAFAVVSWLRRHNLCFSYELLYSILIHALGKSEQLYEAFLLSKTQPLTPLTYNALIGACARNGEIEKALSLMERMRMDGFPPDFVNYCLIVQAVTRTSNGDSSLLARLCDEVVRDGIEMNAELLNDMAVGFARVGDADRAMEFIGMLQGSGLTTKPSTLVAVIQVLGEDGRVEEAEALFEELKEGGLRPRTRAYNAVLNGYVKTRALRDAEKMVSEMERRGVSPDEHTYGSLITAYGSAGRWESARIVLKEMEAAGVKPKCFIYTRILACYRDQGAWEKSFQVLKEMKQSGVKPDKYFYNVIIDTFGKNNCLDLAMDAFERMKLEGVEPDDCTWNTLIDCFVKAGRHEVADDLFRRMLDSGCRPTTMTYNIMLNSYGEQQRWVALKNLLAKMQSQGLLPSVVTYTTLIVVYGKWGKFSDAIECMEVMKASGLKPSPVTYNALINAYAQKGMSDQAFNVFRVMRADGLEPCILAINSLINAFCEDRRDTEAFAVLQYMKENAKLEARFNHLYHVDERSNPCSKIRPVWMEPRSESSVDAKICLEVYEEIIKQVGFECHIAFKLTPCIATGGRKLQGLNLERSIFRQVTDSQVGKSKALVVIRTIRSKEYGEEPLLPPWVTAHIFTYLVIVVCSQEQAHT